MTEQTHRPVRIGETCQEGDFYMHNSVRTDWEKRFFGRVYSYNFGPNYINCGISFRPTNPDDGTDKFGPLPEPALIVTSNEAMSEMMKAEEKLKVAVAALERIKLIYDNTEDAAGVIAKDALNKIINTK